MISRPYKFASLLLVLTPLIPFGIAFGSRANLSASDLIY